MNFKELKHFQIEQDSEQMEEYKGVKFRYVSHEGDIPKEHAKRYLEIDKKLSEFLNPGKNEGNMSLRIPEGFLIKRTGARMTALEKGDIVLVTIVDDSKVHAIGGIPSSETILHNVIYYEKKKTNIILHFHDDALLGKVDGVIVERLPYGTKELADAVGEAAIKGNVIFMKGHGMVLLAENEDELLEILRKLYGK